MSLIGKNIRKVRSIKGLSQSAFANLFNLTRASISAYEEGRAEPKMELTMGIAKYFNIPIETLLTKEITVNEFAKFNLKDFIQGAEEVKIKSIPIISKQNWSQFIKEGNQADFACISFPASLLQGDIAFVVHEKINSNYHSGTVLLCKEESRIAENEVYLILDGEEASIAKGSNLKGKKKMRLYRLLQSIEEVNSVNSNSVEERLSALEAKVLKLEKD